MQTDYRRLMGVKMPRDLIDNLKYAVHVGLPVRICINGLTANAERSQTILEQLSDADQAAPAAFQNYTHNRAGAISGAEIIPQTIWSGPLRGCRRAVEDVTVNVDGKLMLCCEDFHQAHILGDLRTQTLEEILTGETAITYRRRIFGLDAAPGNFICRNCAEAWHGLPEEPLPRTNLL